MKRLLALLLALVLAVGLTGCVLLPDLPDLPGMLATMSLDTADSRENEPDNTKAPAPEDTKAPAPDTKAPEPDTEAPAPDTKAPEPDTEAPAPLPETSSFQGMTAFENDACSVKITDIDPGNFWGYTLNVQLENKLEDKNLSFYVASASLNGVSCNPYFASEVAAGKKANDSISFSDDELKHILGAYTDVEITMRVYDSDDWEADDVAVETFHIYPFGKEKAEPFVRKAQPTDTVLVDNDVFSFVETGYDPEDFWGYAVKLYLVNKTDVPLRFTADDVAVNGFMCDPYWGKTLAPGNCAFADMSWYSSSFEENGITDVEEIEFSLRVYNADDFWADDLYHDTLKITP